MFNVVFWLGYFNSCLNPIIYPCSSKEFKRAFLRILGCQCRGRRRRRRRRLGGCAYTYRPWTRGGSLERSHTRRDSLDDNGSCLSGSQRTLPSASPSPGYLGRGAPPPSVELCAFPEWKAPGALLSLPTPEPPGRRARHDSGPLFTFQLLPDAPSATGPEGGDEADVANGQPGFKTNMPLAPGQF